MTIEQVENGYLLHYSFDAENRYPRRDPMNYEQRQPHVFPSQAALFEYLAQHFTHQCTRVAMDPAPPAPTMFFKDNTHVGPGKLDGMLTHPAFAGAQAGEGIAALQQQGEKWNESTRRQRIDALIPEPPTDSTPGFKNFGRHE